MHIKLVSREAPIFKKNLLATHRLSQYYTSGADDTVWPPPLLEAGGGPATRRPRPHSDRMTNDAHNLQ